MIFAWRPKGREGASQMKSGAKCSMDIREHMERFEAAKTMAFEKGIEGKETGEARA